MVLGAGQGSPGWTVGRSPRTPAVPPIDLNDPVYEWASDGRLSAGTPPVPTQPTNCLRFMTLTDPNGRSVTFVPGETLPAWALPYR